ncbi:hypothetical protein VNI00_002130 [Paramarasmius palmivorus]|uniref:Uncharacterized protein n=1 Tax=Paramarasmius palmivorus TaxID=297713 RepID=A0AAW0E0B4_9AGAR
MSSMDSTPIHSQRSSLLSFPTQTEFSFSTRTGSSETINGPGALSGRYINELGELTLKGINILVVYRKLRNIERHFPHGNEEPVPYEMYGHLLELCRPDLYRRQFRQRALRIVLTQIARRHTTQLLHRCSRWPATYLREVLVELARCLQDAQWQGNLYASPSYQDIARIYTNQTHKSEPHPVLPFLDFLLCIVQLDSDYLDCVLISSASFRTLATSHQHPLGDEAGQLPFSIVTIKYNRFLRRNVWRDLGVQNVLRRLRNMYREMSFGSERMLLDACLDALDFVCSNQDPHIKELALRFIVQVLVLSPRSYALHTLAQAISLFSFSEQLHVLSEMMVGIEQGDIDDFDIESTLHTRFIEFSLLTAAQSQDTQEALICAGIREFFLFAVSRQLDDARYRQTLRDYTTLEIVRSVVKGHLPVSLVQVPDESKSLWKNVVEVFGWPDDEWERRSFTELLNRSALAMTTVVVEMVDTAPEDTFLLEISVQHSGRSWEVRKTLTDLKKLSHRVQQKGRSTSLDETTLPSPLWRPYSSLQSRDKEVFVEELLSGLTKLHLRGQCQEIVAFLSTDVMYGAYPQERKRVKVNVPIVTIAAITEKGLQGQSRSFLDLEDEEKEFKQVAKMLALL